MKLAEKLYSLRKKSGLSQEQLAQVLDVSRQAISKWETGAAAPEGEKLVAISRYFHVTLDYLMKEEVTQTEAEALTSQPHGTDTRLQRAGLILCIVGIVLLIALGVISIFTPAAAAELAGSSMITLNGTGIAMLCCVAAIVVGAILFLKKSDSN